MDKLTEIDMIRVVVVMAVLTSTPENVTVSFSYPPLNESSTLFLGWFETNSPQFIGVDSGQVNVTKVLGSGITLQEVEKAFVNIIGQAEFRGIILRTDTFAWFALREAAVPKPIPPVLPLQPLPPDPNLEPKKQPHLPMPSLPKQIPENLLSTHWTYFLQFASRTIFSHK